jgi:hypothetical protein
MGNDADEVGPQDIEIMGRTREGNLHRQIGPTRHMERGSAGARGWVGAGRGRSRGLSRAGSAGLK